MRLYLVLMMALTVLAPARRCTSLHAQIRSLNDPGQAAGGRAAEKAGNPDGQAAPDDRDGSVMTRIERLSEMTLAGHPAPLIGLFFILELPEERFILDDLLE